MSVSDIEITTWLLWVASGIIMAFIAAGFWGGIKMLGFDLFVGVACSIAGGWCTAYVMGDDSKLLLIISVLTALFVGGLGVYILNRLAFRNARK